MLFYWLKESNLLQLIKKPLRLLVVLVTLMPFGHINAKQDHVITMLFSPPQYPPFWMTITNHPRT